MKYKLEVIGFSIEGCVAAQASGAHRIELCDNPGEGGTTPSYGFIKKAREVLSIELYIMIRPRGGDFIYSRDEIEIMKQDILVAKELGCDGIVLGILNEKGQVNFIDIKMLTDVAYPMGVTFHRAFDRVKDPFQALEDIRNAGCERILTSGLEPTAKDGAGLLEKLIEKAGDLIIMPGSGIRSDNILELANKLKTFEFHSSARIARPSKQAASLLNEKMDVITVDIEEVENIIKKLSSLNTLNNF